MKNYNYIIYSKDNEIKHYIRRIKSNDTGEYFNKRLDEFESKVDIKIIKVGEFQSDSPEEDIQNVIRKALRERDLIREGTMVSYLDEGRHTALVLYKSYPQSLLLFATTNPKWNSRSRKLTEDENKLLGFPIDRTTYWAPVVRRNEYMRSQHKTFPKHRVLELQKEFGLKDYFKIREDIL